MLRRLTVKNLAVVEDLEIELEPGLTVITGETGAGKSILVDALSLLAGGRGSVDLVRQGALRLSVTGEFDADAAVRRILADAGVLGGRKGAGLQRGRAGFGADSGEGRRAARDDPRPELRAGARRGASAARDAGRVRPGGKGARGDGRRGGRLEGGAPGARGSRDLAAGPGIASGDARLPGPRDHESRARREGGGGSAAGTRAASPRGPYPARGRDGAPRAVRGGGVGRRPPGGSREGLRGARGDRSP